jgi:hypothetical protein
MDKRGPGSLRGLGSFEGVHPPFIDLTLMPPRAAVHCLHAHAAVHMIKLTETREITLTFGCLRTRSGDGRPKRTGRSAGQLH